MIFLAKVINVNSTTNPNSEIIKNKVQIRITPLHNDYLDADLPYIRPILQNENEFSNLNKDDLIYVYSEDELLQEIYFFGKYNTNIDLSQTLSNINNINTNLNNNNGVSIKSLTEYNLNDNKIKIQNYGNQLMIMNGEDDFTLIAEKTNGSLLYIDATTTILVNNDNKIVMETDTGIVVDQGESKLELNENFEETTSGNKTETITGDYTSEFANGNITGSTSITITQGNNSIVMNSGGIEITGSPAITISGGNVKITGGMLSVDGSATPTGSGAFNAIPVCPFAGIIHNGNIISGT
jgi:hypothetical protein